MRRNIAIVVLTVLLLLSLAVSGYLFIDRSIAQYHLTSDIDIRATYMNAYDRLVCDLICGKTIDEANALLAPNMVVRFKQRQDLAKLHIGDDRIDVCLQGDIITAVESSPYFDDKPDCLRNINLSDGSSQGPATPERKN